MSAAVSQSEAFVELDAVKNMDGTIIQTDVFQVDIAVTFANEAAINPLLEDGLMFSGECFHPGPDKFAFVGRKRHVFKQDGLFEVFLPVEHDPFQAAVVCYGR